MPKKKAHSTLQQDITLLFELGSLRFVDRTWQQFLQVHVANNAEHMFRVMWIALVIARHEGVKSEEKILKMALLHDIGESRTPDTNYISKLYSSRNEELAVTHMLEGTVLQGDMLALWKEYEERKTIEAKIVKDADYLDVDFELQEHTSRGSMIKKNWKRKAIRMNLYTKTAKNIWDELRTADPHTWHISAHKTHTKERKYE